MITSREIANAANEWKLRHDVVEKDYVLGWLLAGIAYNPVTDRWAFKGGTCLRKCWFETYRFSEDLDFTVSEEDLDPERLAVTFTAIGEWLQGAWANPSTASRANHLGGPETSREDPRSLAVCGRCSVR